MKILNKYYNFAYFLLLSCFVYAPNRDNADDSFHSKNQDMSKFFSENQKARFDFFLARTHTINGDFNGLLHRIELLESKCRIMKGDLLELKFKLDYLELEEAEKIASTLIDTAIENLNLLSSIKNEQEKIAKKHSDLYDKELKFENHGIYFENTELLADIRIVQAKNEIINVQLLNKISKLEKDILEINGEKDTVLIIKDQSIKEHSNNKIPETPNKLKKYSVENKKRSNKFFLLTFLAILGGFTTIAIYYIFNETKR